MIEQADCPMELPWMYPPRSAPSRALKDCVQSRSLYVLRSEGQLWGASVASAEDPELWAKERSDEGEADDVEPRQLGGIERRGALELQSG